MSYQSRFVTANIEYICKKQVMAYNTSAHLGVSSALGALGRRFESYRLDSVKPSNCRKFPRLSVLFFAFSEEKGELRGEPGRNY